MQFESEVVNTNMCKWPKTIWPPAKRNNTERNRHAQEAICTNLCCTYEYRTPFYLENDTNGILALSHLIYLKTQKQECNNNFCNP